MTLVASTVEQPTLDGLPLQAATISYALTPLHFEPDTKYRSSNAGINTAGRIVEVVSGLPFERFVEERLFQPLGMTGLGFSTNGQTFGHGGGHATNMTVDPATGLATVWMVQHAGFPGDGGTAQGEFQKAAQAAFARRPE